MTEGTLSDLHEMSWSGVEGVYVEVRQEITDHATIPPGTETRRREGEIVGRAEGTGLYYDQGHSENIVDNIGPCIYIETPQDTVLEVRTDKPGNELLAFEDQ